MAKIVFWGAGRMAAAMVEGMLAKGACRPEEVICTSARDNTAETLAERTGIAFSRELPELMLEASVLVLAVKPQQLDDLPIELAEATDGTLIVSILAGTPLSRLGEKFPRARNIVRVMPNTPGQIGAGISGVTARDSLSEDDAVFISGMLDALGEWVEVSEEQLHALTGVSGSGPAYVFEFIAALREAGETAGLDRDVAGRLALETVYGAARLVRESGLEPEVLRDRVTSPGGTTLAALEALKKGGFRALIRETVLAAQQRSRELSR